MNNISKIGFIIFIVFVSGIIIYSITTTERFGDSYIDQLRIADADETLETFSDEIVIEIGKSVCNEAINWIDEETSSILIQNILLENGIEVKIHYPVPIYLQPALKKFGYQKGDFPVADSHVSKIITLPCDQHLTKDEQDYIINIIRKFYL